MPRVTKKTMHMTEDQQQLLNEVFRSPFATVEHLARIHRHDDKTRLRSTLQSLIEREWVYVVPYRDARAASTVHMHYISAEGVNALAKARGWDGDESYGARTMTSREWERHLLRHPDIVKLAYDICSVLADARPEKPTVYFPRQGSFDALMWGWGDLKTGLTVSVVRKGPLLTNDRLVGRMLAVRKGDDLLNHHERYSRGRRGPAVNLIVVQTEMEKSQVVRELTTMGKLWFQGLACFVATEEEAARGVWEYHARGREVISTGDIAFAEPYPSHYAPYLPWYTSHTPLPPGRLPKLLSPVQTKVLDCLFRWPLMRPTEIPLVIGTGYGGRFNDHLQELRDRGLVKDIRDLVAAGLVRYDRGEYRNFPLLLSDAGLKFLVRRDRARHSDILPVWGTEQVDRETGRVKLGTLIGKMIRDIDHTLGINSLLARICSELSYTPEALPDHMASRFYRLRRWRNDRWHPSSSVAPDAAIVLRNGDDRQTILLEYERQATRGGRALTRKVNVWLEYWKHRRHDYIGDEIVAFVVPRATSAQLLAQRYQRERAKAWQLRGIYPMVVIDYETLADSETVLDAPWIVADDTSMTARLSL